MQRDLFTSDLGAANQPVHQWYEVWLGGTQNVSLRDLLNVFAAACWRYKTQEQFGDSWKLPYSPWRPRSLQHKVLICLIKVTVLWRTYTESNTTKLQKISYSSMPDLYMCAYFSLSISWFWSVPHRSIIMQAEIWIINNSLGFGYETMVCAIYRTLLTQISRMINEAYKSTGTHNITRMKGKHKDTVFIFYGEYGIKQQPNLSPKIMIIIIIIIFIMLNHPLRLLQRSVRFKYL